MTSLDTLRLVWTVVMATGVGYGAYLVWEGFWNDWAAHRLGKPAEARIARGELWDVSVLTVKSVALFLAGLTAYFGQPMLAVPLIVLSAFLLVGLLHMKATRWRQEKHGWHLEREARKTVDHR